MAIYDYSCGVCKKSKTIIRGIADPEESYFCDSCKTELKRVYSNIGVSFSGSGFYTTDKRKV